MENNFKKLTKKLNDININDIVNMLENSWKTKHTLIDLKRTLESVNGIEYISSGSSRLVYSYKNKYAIKVAKNKKGLAQNEVESDWGLQQYDVATKLIHTNDDGIFVISELCKKCLKSDFKKIENITFTTYCDCLQYYYQNIKPNKYYHIAKPTYYDESWEDADSLLYRMYNYIGDFGVPIGDLIRISSYGINDNGDIVLVDTGFNQDVSNKFYRG